MSSVQRIEEAMETAAVGGLPPGASDRLLTYLELLLRWNARFNLTAVRSPDGIIRRHFVESVFAAGRLPKGISALLDFGSGAGFPGIPITLCRPEIQVTLSESQSKKAAFLQEAVRVLGLGAEVYAGRVENLPPGRVFDAVTMRAVDRMSKASKTGGAAGAIHTARPRAARALILLASDVKAAEYQALAPEYEWRPGLRLPNSDHGLLLIGERAGVPRGT
jgi:16S rRNA (guanine527-N7)-methyltransferase